MKKIYKVNDCNSEGMGKPWVKSRITMACPLLTLVMILMLGAWSVPAWGAWSGSGSGTLKNGVWYVFYETSEASLNKGNSKECALLGPGAQLSFEAKRTIAGTGSITVSQDKGTTQLYSDNPGTSYGGCGSPYSLNVNSTKITFKNTSTISTNTTKYVRNIKVTMAQYLNNPTKTDLDCGTADINSDATSGQVNVAWCNVPAMSYEITDDAEGLFSVSVDVNSEAGKYNTSQFTVTYKHTKAGTHTAKLKITDSYNSYSKTVNLTGTTNKMQPEGTWSPNDETFNVDDVLTATNSNGLTVTLSGNNTYVG